MLAHYILSAFVGCRKHTDVPAVIQTVKSQWTHHDTTYTGPYSSYFGTQMNFLPPETVVMLFV